MSDLNAADKSAADNEPSKRKIKQTAWHPGFCAAMRLECREWRDDLTFLEELPLGSEPNIIDLVVIKKNSNVEISNLIGKNFRETNILEFKSPDDGMTVDDFYMALSYACEYKSQGESVNSRRSSGITITLVQEGFPRMMFEDLKHDGAVIENPHRGLYIVKEISPFFTQVVVYGRMKDEDGLIWLRTLTKRMTPPEFRRLADGYNAEKDIENRRNLHALISIAVRSNVPLYQQEVVKTMLELKDLKVLFKNDFAEAEARGIINMGREFRLSNDDIISRLMSMLGFSRDDAASMLMKFS